MYIERSSRGMINESRPSLGLVNLIRAHPKSETPIFGLPKIKASVCSVVLVAILTTEKFERPKRIRTVESTESNVRSGKIDGAYRNAIDMDDDGCS